MASFTHRRGSAEPLVFQPEQPDGTLPDLRDLTMELRVAVPGQCLILPGRAVADGYEIDLDQIDQPPGIYTASIWFRDLTGSSYAGDIHILIEEGC